jgi:hypothetical protein
LGEPETLKYRAGRIRIDLCTARALQDTTVATLFGGEEDIRKGLIEFEFLVDLNSFLAADGARSPDISAYMQATYSPIDFSFWPSLIAFDLCYIVELADEIFTNLQLAETTLLSSLLFDSKEAEILISSGPVSYLRFLRYIQNEHGSLMLQLRRLSSHVYWPKELGDALKGLPRT